MQVSSEIISVISEQLQKQHGFCTTTQLDRAVADILKRAGQRESRGNAFSLSRAVRGMAAAEGRVLNEKTKQEDLDYIKALDTASVPGSYLVPTMQASEMMEYLSSAGIARLGGVRIWPMDGIQKMNVPAATATPTWVWMSQTSAQAPTDPNLSPATFDLKERRSLTAVSNQLLRVSSPPLDTLLAELIGVGAAEHEDTAFFNTTTVTGGPTALYAAAGTNKIHAAGNATSGGNLVFTDILAVLAKAASVKAKGPFVWFMSPRTWWQRVQGMIDLQSRPIAIPTGVSGLAAPVAGMLMGFPVFVTSAIPENEAVVSGTNQSHLIFTNPRYLHIAQDGAVEIAVSTERYFDSAETAIRAVQHEDFAFCPAAGVVILDGIN